MTECLSACPGEVSTHLLLQLFSREDLQCKPSIQTYQSTARCLGYSDFSNFLSINNFTGEATEEESPVYYESTHHLSFHLRWWAAVAWNFWQQTEKQVCNPWTCPPSLSSSLKHCFVLTRVSNKNTRFVLTRGMLEQTTSISEQPQILLSLSPQGSIPHSKNPTL